MIFETELHSTGVVSLVHRRNGWAVRERRKVPFYWPLTQNWNFIRPYIWGNIQTGVARLANKLFGIVTLISELRVERFDHLTGIIWDYGVTSRRVVTDAFVALVVDACDTGASPALDLFNFTGYGSGTTAEAATQTALTTEFTTQYATNSTRPTATVTQPTASQLRLVTTFAPDESATVEECAPFTSATVAAGSMMDRSLTGTQTMISGDTLATTYTLSLTSGG